MEASARRFLEFDTSSRPSVIPLCRLIGTCRTLVFRALPQALYLATISEMAKHVLLCPPAYFDVVDRKNSYMLPNTSVDQENAQRQWQALFSALEQTGCQVETIAPAPGLEDMVFAANQVFVGFHERIGKFIVPSRMVHASRPVSYTHLDVYKRQAFHLRAHRVRCFRQVLGDHRELCLLYTSRCV